MVATAQIVDIDTAYANAKEVLDATAPGSELEPLEPTPMEFGPNAVAVTVTSPEGTDVFAVDATTENPETFDPAAAIASLIERLAADLDITSDPLADSEELAATLESASHFRASVVTAGEPTGEFRFSMGGDKAVSEEEEEASIGTDRAATRTDDPPATPATQLPAAPDLSELANRLPNLAAVNMDVTVELGRVRLPIKELLGLGNGSVVRLGTPIGESFDILVNGKAAARGDLVVVGGKLAVRIRELLGIEA